jgi:hypothetical protein
LISIAQWQLANIGFQRERAQVERESWWERIFQSQSPNGILHFGERIAAIENHFAADFREALAHISGASRGMVQLFNYTPRLPQEGRAGYLDDVVAWAARARSRLAQITRSEQLYVLTLSIKDLTKTQCEPGRAAPQWTFDTPAERRRHNASAVKNAYGEIALQIAVCIEKYRTGYARSGRLSDCCAQPASRESGAGPRVRRNPAPPSHGWPG